MPADFMAALERHGLAISALNCSGNQLHPGESGRVTMRSYSIRSGSPAWSASTRRHDVRLAGRAGRRNPNWITTEWPPECLAILDYQWNEQLIPYWRNLAGVAPELGVRRICLELHGSQAVHNPSTLMRLREVIGPLIGANYDPSHPMWMGADPLAAIRFLGSAIYYVHAKDTRVEPIPTAIDGVLDTRPSVKAAERSWNYVTLGYGHGEEWWRQFCAALRMVGYDGVLSIEHEDFVMSPLEGVRRASPC